VCAKTSLVPTVLLDDVFSELDPGRSRALVAELPAGQALLTTAAPLPGGIDVARVLDVEALERS
jgi:DNA replication and repair protein RecF